MTALTVVLVLLATYRLTLLVVADELTEPPRAWLLRRLPNGRVAFLLSCPWCASFWVGMVVAWSGWCWGDRAWWAVPALALAASASAGFLAHYASPES